MEKTRSILQAALSIALVAGATVAQANPFYLAPATVTGALTWDGASDGYAAVQVTAPVGYTGSAGQFQGWFDPNGEDSGVGHETDDFFRFFCIDLYQSATSTSTTYTRYTGLDAAHSGDLNQITRLFDAYYPIAAAGSFGGNATLSAAMQLAIWNIWYDDDSSVTSGTFSVASAGTNAAALSKANEMLATAAGTGALNHSGTWTFYRFVNDGKQDYLAATYQPSSFDPPTRVPEPASLALLGIGLAGLGLARRKAI